MTTQEFIEYCLNKRGAYLDFPFGDASTTVKVGKRIFAQAFVLKGVDTVTLNCSREGGEFYRAAFPGLVTRGYHCPPVQQPYFDTMPLDAIPDVVLIEMIDHSYSYVFKKLPKAVRMELAEPAE